MVEEKKSSESGSQKVVEKAPVKAAVAQVDPEAEAVKLLGRKWNVIVNAMQTAEKAWGEMLEIQLRVSRERLMSAPLEVQKALSRFGKAQFNVMLSRFVDYYRSQGGLEAMKIKEVK